MEFFDSVMGSAAGVIEGSLEYGNLYPALASWTFYTPFAYVCLLGFAFLFREWCPNFKIGPTAQYWHNMFLAIQSIFLVFLLNVAYWDIGRIIGTGVFSIDPFFSNRRFESKLLEPIISIFLLSKIYEWFDTVILVINKKPLLLLHVWHHSSTYVSFASGLYCYSKFYIGYLNAILHVAMYLFYAKVKWIKPFAKYITITQIIQLFGGSILNIYSLIDNPDEFHPLTRKYAIINCFMTTTYWLLFMQFYFKKYKKVDKSD